jgi:hypothetical protein
MGTQAFQLEAAREGGGRRGVRLPLCGTAGLRRAIGSAIEIDQRQKFLNRVGASSVYLTVCWMFLCPR